MTIQFTVNSANPGDVAVITFNGTWKAKWTCDDGTGTVGKYEIYNGGTLVTSKPSTDQSGTVLTLCLAKAVDPGQGPSTDTGSAVTGFGWGAYISSVTTFAMGFGTGGTNTGSMVFCNLSFFQNDLTDTGGNTVSDPLNCGTCGCPGIVPGFNTTADQIKAMQFTLNISEAPTVFPCFPNGNPPPIECEDCAYINGSFVMTYADPPTGTGLCAPGSISTNDDATTFVFQYSKTFGPDCSGDGGTITMCLTLTIKASQCGVEVFLAGAYGPVCVNGNFVLISINRPPLVPPIDVTNLTSLNTALASTTISFSNACGNDVAGYLMAA